MVWYTSCGQTHTLHNQQILCSFNSGLTMEEDHVCLVLVLGEAYDLDTANTEGE